MSLFIGCITESARVNDLEVKKIFFYIKLQKIFEKYGKLKKCEIKGTYGFVVFEDEKEAEKAKSELNSTELCGRR